MNRASRATASLPRRRGFTLVEVLVALIIVALGAAAVMSALRTAADSAARQRERMLAGYVAMNRLVETRLEPEFPATGTREGESEMGGRRWRWRQEVTRTALAGVLQVTVQVRAAEGAEDAWTVTLVGARGQNLLADPAYDRLWDLARREGG
jgi:general secretion pathway protein I